MMIFGGKLMTTSQQTKEPALEKMTSSAHAQKFALHSLSSQEKLLLVELQKTRAQIVSELSKIDPAACGSDDNWFSVKDTIEGYEQKMIDASKPYIKSTPLKKAAKAARRHLKPLPASPAVSMMMAPSVGSHGPIKLSTFKTGVDMLPIMASTGDAALEVGLKKQGKLQLPVFKLPSLDTSQYQKKVINGTSVHIKTRPKSGSSGRPDAVHVANRGLVYRNRTEFLHAVAAMHTRMQVNERSYVQRHLRMSERDISEVGQDIELELLMQDHEEADHARQRGLLLRGGADGLFEDSVDASTAAPAESSQPLSLFMRVAYMDRVQRQAVVRYSEEAPSSSSVADQDPLDSSYEEFGPTRSVTSYSVPSSPKTMDLQRQPGLMISQMRSMPNMPSMPLHGDSYDTYSSMNSPARSSHLSVTQGLPQSMQGGGTGRSPAHLNHNTDLSAILSTPGGKRRLSKSGPFSPISHATGPVSSTVSKKTTRGPSHSQSQDLSSIREAYGTARRGKKRLLGTKGSITAWGVDDMSASHDPEQAAASKAANATQALKMELMRSLNTMQHHTAMVKDDILRIQNVVDVQNPKAKSFMFAMAAERMVTALQTCVLKELRRGMRAWKLAVKQEERKAMVDVYVRFHGLRYLAQSLKWLMHVALIKKWVKWVAHAQSETTRLRLIVENKAAVVIQTRARGMLARMRVSHLRKLKKYEHLYTACIEIQRMFRGKPVRWRYLAWKRSEKRRKRAIKIQSQWRRYLAAKRVRAIRFSLDKSYAATVINSLVRMYNAKIRVARIRQQRLHYYCAIQIQRVVRGFLGRCRVTKLLQDLEEFYAARLIQTRIRMFLARRFLIRKRIQTHAYWKMRAQAAVLIQKTYRGFRGRLKARVFTMEITRKRRRIFNAATKIINMCRAFVARRKLRRLKAERTTRWIAQARAWKEMWSEDAQDWFYYAEATQDSVWEPKKEGYTKTDGRVVLEDGSIIVDPDVAAALDMDMMRMPKEMCSECNERYAIRSCNQCEDSYCTPCYKNAHATGTRKKHTYVAVGPVDCGECENLLAERWCVTCDEAHCDYCWRKLHSKGKRRFHPFCKVWPGGKVGKQMMTMDGEELTDTSYDPTFLLRRYEQEQAAQAPPQEYNYTYPAEETYDDTAQQQLEYAQGGTDWLQQQQDAPLAITNGQEGSWETAYDEEGNVYYYNTVSGVSQYEDPSSQDAGAQHMKSLLEQWAQAYDDEGNVYWYNSTTGASQYENPFATEETDEASAEGGGEYAGGDGQGGYEGYGEG